MSIPTFSVEGLISWLERQPLETEYDFTDITDCLLCRYGRARGLDVNSAGSNTISHRSGGRIIVSTVFPDDTCIAGTRPYTYGAALARAKALVT